MTATEKLQSIAAGPDMKRAGDAIIQLYELRLFEPGDDTWLAAHHRAVYDFTWATLCHLAGGEHVVRQAQAEKREMIREAERLSAELRDAEKGA
jgi:hypothetical protein